MPIQELQAYSREINAPLPRNNTAQSSASYWAKEVTDRTGDVKNILIKPLYHVTGWMNEAGIADQHSWAKPLGDHSKITKNFLSATEILPNSVKVAHGLGEMVASRTGMEFAEAAHKTVIDGSGLVSSVCDGLETGLKTGIVPHAPETLNNTLRTIGMVNSGSLFVASVNGIGTEMNKIASSRINDPTLNATLADAERHKVGNSVLNFGKWTCYLGLSTTSILGFAGVIATAAPWVFLAWSTGALACTISQFFYKRAFNVQS